MNNDIWPERREGLASLSFNLPFSLRVEGSFQVVDEDFCCSVTLKNLERQTPIVPGIEKFENAALSLDDTNYISCTHVSAYLKPEEIPSLLGTEFLNYSAAALIIARTLVGRARVCFGEFIWQIPTDASQLGRILQIGPTTRHEKKFWQGGCDSWIGGIGPNKPPREERLVHKFGELLAMDWRPSVATELFLDSKRFQIYNNHRMALVTASIGFEIWLTNILAEKAEHTNRTSLLRKIKGSTLGQLGGELIKKIGGFSLVDESYWGIDVVTNFRIVSTVRDGILHKGKMDYVLSNQRYDLQSSEAVMEFHGRIANLMAHIDRALRSGNTRDLTGEILSK